MSSNNIISVPLANLLIDQTNPRHTEQPNQREAIATIAFNQGIKLVTLAEDIAEQGLNPGDIPLIAPTDQEGIYIVLEGNRRIAALKLMTNPDLLSSIGLPRNLAKRYKDLHSDYGSRLPNEISCAVIPREESHHWISQKHTGENDGAGIVMWDGRAKHRFRGMSPALQAIDLVEKSSFIDNETKSKLEKISITNVERILGTPDARRELGVDVQKGELLIVAPEQETLARLAMVVADIANKKKKVTDLDNKEQRVAYAKEVAARPLITPHDEDGSGNSTTNSVSTASKLALTVTTQRIKPDRKTLIPRQFKIAIQHPRINHIYHELLKLSVDDFPNCAAAMFRVFIELSVDQYGKVKNINLTYPPNAKSGGSAQKLLEMKLSNKLATVVEYMSGNQILTKDELRGIRTLIQKGDHVLSVESLNAYIHNKDYHPAPSDLKANWDSIQLFVEKLWAA